MTVVLDTFSVDYDKNREFFVPGKFQPNSDADYLGPMEDFLRARGHRAVLSAEQLDAAQHTYELQEENSKKLEEMRITVDEKLHATLHMPTALRASRLLHVPASHPSSTA